jgi:hypothetical protein
VHLIAAACGRREARHHRRLLEMQAVERRAGAGGRGEARNSAGRRKASNSKPARGGRSAPTPPTRVDAHVYISWCCGSASAPLRAVDLSAPSRGEFSRATRLSYAAPA